MMLKNEDRIKSELCVEEFQLHLAQTWNIQISLQHTVLNPKQNKVEIRAQTTSPTPIWCDSLQNDNGKRWDALDGG